MPSRKVILIILLALAGFTAWGQSTYHEQRATQFELLPTDSNDIIFLGNSITDGGNWSELFDNLNCKNRGISADISEGLLDRLEPITTGQPAKIFIMIGINDLSQNVPVLKIAQNYIKIIQNIQESSPQTKIYIQSVLPVNPDYEKFSDHVNKSAQVSQLNWHLRKIASQHSCSFVDLYSEFITDGTKLNPEYTNDGLHLTGAGYLKWRDILLPHIEE